MNRRAFGGEQRTGGVMKRDGWACRLDESYQTHPRIRYRKRLKRPAKQNPQRALTLWVGTNNVLLIAQCGFDIGRWSMADAFTRLVQHTSAIDSPSPSPSSLVPVTTQKLTHARQWCTVCGCALA